MASPVYTRNSCWCSRLYEKFGFKWEIWMASPVCTRNSCRCSGCVCEIRMGVQLRMKNSALYEKFAWLPPVYTRNSYGCSVLYNKFGFIGEIHMASPVCTRNSCGWSGLYEKFTNHGYTAIQRVIFQVSTVSRNKNIKQRSVELRAPFFRFKLWHWCNWDTRCCQVFRNNSENLVIYLVLLQFIIDEVRWMCFR